MIYYQVIQDTTVEGGAIINLYSDKKKQSLIETRLVAGFEPTEDHVNLDLPNWRGITVDLEQRAIPAIGLQRINPNGLTIFLKYLTDGEAGYSKPSSFPIYFSYLGLTMSSEEKALINEILTDNGFNCNV